MPPKRLECPFCLLHGLDHASDVVVGFQVMPHRRYVHCLTCKARGPEVHDPNEELAFRAALSAWSNMIRNVKELREAREKSRDYCEAAGHGWLGCRCEDDS